MFAVIYAPDSSLQVVLRHEPGLRGNPVAVTDDQRPARVLEMSPEARAKGMIAGMTSPQALGRCPDAAFRIPSAGLLESAQEALVQLACAHSPFVESTRQGVCTLDLKGNPIMGSPRLRRGGDGILPSRTSIAQELSTDFLPFEESSFPRNAETNTPEACATQTYRARAEVIVSQAARMDLAVRVGVASNPDLALLAAQMAEPFLQVEDASAFLAPLPVSVLAPPSEIASRLKRWGVYTLGAFAALPVDELTARLGPEGFRLWELATGSADRMLTLVRAENTFEEAVDFDYEIETMEPLLFVLRRFLEQISGRLEVFGLVAGMLDFQLTFANGARHERRFSVPAPTRDVDVLFRMIHTHVEKLTAEAPIVRLRIEAMACHPRDQQFGLFENALRNPSRFYETLAQLGALVGTDRVGTPRSEDTHRPDAFRMLTPDFSGDAIDDRKPDPPVGLPLQRYRPPMPVRVAMESSRPSAVFSDALHGAVRDASGPWRASGDWWGKESWEQDEWDVQVADGLYRISRKGKAWQLDGVYG